MRSPCKTKRSRGDAESELNLPPGFRFNPTDEELIVHYLCRKSSPPLSIIADVDLYKHEPWDLPEMALFGTKEWYFFTPRDKKYQNGSRPNRVTRNGYWKATGADKPIKSKSDPNTSTVGIKKALVYYSGKGTKGIKTNWIMHEYRLPIPDVVTPKHTTDSKDWVLCRLYNKKNNSKEMVIQENDDIRCTSDLHPKSQLGEIQREESYSNNSSSLNSFEYSDGEFNGNGIMDSVKSEESNIRVAESLLRSEDVDNGNNWLDGLKFEDFQHEFFTAKSDESNMGLVMQNNDQDYGNEWLDSFSLEDLHHYMEAMPPNHGMPMMDFYSTQQQFSI